MRVLLRVLSPLLGLVIAAAGAMLAVEVVAAWLLGDRPGYRGLLLHWGAWRTVLEQITWRSVLMIGCSVVVAVIGLLLLLIAGTARRRDIALTDPADEISVTASPKVLARLVGQRVRSTDDISAASVIASARSVRVQAIGRGERPSSLRPSVRTRVDELLDDLPLARRPKVSVSVRAERGLR